MRRSTAAPGFVAWLCDSVGNCCRHSVERVIVLGRFLAMFWYLGASCICHANSCPQACGEMVFASQWGQHGSKMGPKWLPGGLLESLGILKASWSGLGGLLGRPGRPLGYSWGGLGGFLDALGRVLGALEAVLEAS